MDVEKVKRNVRNLTNEQLNRLKNSLVVFDFDDEESIKNKQTVATIVKQELDNRNDH